MKSGRVDTMERWRDAEAYFSTNGYTLYQMQYGTDDPHGFHAWFISRWLPDIEIVTFNGDVKAAIVSYNGEHRRNG
ncbi:MAG TPA: hypothetical protein VN608_05565 [Clostridia bacterium]|nr:hypothetical protein [Clostridia bacterium]